MLRWLLRAMFLVKEIHGRNGKLHFQRFRLLSTPWFSIFVHRILESDLDVHLHDHPWSFVSFILWGSYIEASAKSPSWATPVTRTTRPGSVVYHHHSDAHSLKLLTKVVWSLVFVGAHKYDWGYQTEYGWVDHDRYRQRKRAGLWKSSP